MAEQKYFSILTPYGMEKTTGTFVGEPSVKPVYMAYGDGGGSFYTPVEGQTALKNTVFEVELSNLYPDLDNPYWIVAEAMIPRNIGGFWIREFSVRDANHIDIAISNYPERYKPLLEEGAPTASADKLIFQVSNTQNIEFSITPVDVLSLDDIWNAEKPNTGKSLLQVLDQIEQSLSGLSGGTTYALKINGV